MRTKIFIPILLLIAVLIWLFFTYHKNSSLPLSEGKFTDIGATNNSKSNIEATVASGISNSGDQPRLSSEERVEQIKRSLEEGKNEWRAPINFFGKVVDEKNNPVSGASVHFIWTDLSPTGNSEHSSVSDAGGFFSLRDTTGKNLIVTVSKAGFYEYAPSGLAFNYSGENQNFVPDSRNPVVFRLRKKGEGGDLIHLHTSFRIPKDGTPVLVDLATGKQTSLIQNALNVECWTHDNEKKAVWKFDWKCRVSVPGGGLQIYEEQFPFLAPEDAYVPEVIIDMPVADNPQWSQDVRRKLYVKTADGKFARMEFRMIAHGDHFFQIDSFFNPDGSRNLEPKQ